MYDRNRLRFPARCATVGTWQTLREQMSDLFLPLADETEMVGPNPLDVFFCSIIDMCEVP